MWYAPGNDDDDDRRLVEFAASIKATFEPIIQTPLYPRSQIDIFIHVLQQDGGILPTSINASTLALIDAGISLSDFVVSLSCGLHSTSPLLDLNQAEESDLPHLTVAVLPRSSKVTLASLETRLHVTRFQDVFQLAVKACSVLHKEMEDAVRERTKRLVEAARPRGREKDEAWDEMDEA
ncbi:Exosome non-catalytic core component [Thecaphora frezii]